MTAMFMNLFDIHFIVFNMFDYPVSLLELTGTLTGLACVYLTAKEKISCWPVGIVNIVLFLALFYQVQLYSDMILQVFFLIMSVYGWWKWANPKTQKETDTKNELKISDLHSRGWAFWIIGIAVSTLILGFVMKDIHHYLPSVFPEPAAFPYPDALTTTLSIAATIIMALKMRACWILWITVDIIATVIYFVKGIHLVAIEYIVFGLISWNGYRTWTSIKNQYSDVVP